MYGFPTSNDNRLKSGKIKKKEEKDTPVLPSQPNLPNSRTHSVQLADPYGSPDC